MLIFGLPIALWTLLCLMPAGPANAETLQVAVIELEGFCMRDLHGKWVGLMPDLVRELGKELHFQPNFTLVADGRYGAYDEKNDTWSGLIGEVYHNRADFAAAPLTITALREKHVDFSYEFMDTGLTVVVRRPRWKNQVSRSITFFLGVFDAGVWCASFVIFALTGFFLFLNDRYNPREFRARQAEHSARDTSVSHALLAQMNDFSLFGSLYYTISTGCFQGYRRSPKSLVGRCLSAFWWLFVCAFAASYTAAFLCALVASRGGLERQFGIEDIPELNPVGTDAFKGATPVWFPNSNTHRFFKNSQDPVMQMFYRQYMAGLNKNSKLANVNTVEALLELVKTDDRYFAVMESTMADFYSRYSGCEVIAAATLISDNSYAFAFPVGSKKLRDVNKVLLTLRESGFINKMYRKYFLMDHGPCWQSVPPAETVAMSLAGEEMARMFRSSLPLTLHSFSGPVLFYFASLLLSAAAALADVYIFTRYERYKQGNQPLQNTAEQPERAEQLPEPEASFGALRFSDDQQQLSP
ncbi:hypothetical protein BOX15_Mlig002294g4 [Macrostomum lignano]|uniref:Uncharacterized protein n=2 Tax=Macrostomum lignano TaxID=282301 RepID=A0A267F971_9PLAT|nr:hypothetical protein BOX15_Mlig002294g4 [Macrostomum lignano]